MPAPFVLNILDGWGHAEPGPHNAISLANTPTWDKFWQERPHTLLSCSGLDVGLPKGQMGNSEVGHMTIGAGRAVLQDLTRIDLAIQSGEFYSNSILLKAVQHSKNNNTPLHIMGLLSPGGVHSHEEHLVALLKLAKQENIKQVLIHAFLDGRDTPPKSAMKSLKQCETLCLALGNAKIASISGRYYSMDRDNRWDRTQKSLDMLTQHDLSFKADSAINGLQAAYDRGETDEFVQPTQIINRPIQNNDSIVFFNFRPDRARQLTQKLIQDFPASPFCSFAEYDSDFPTQIAFPKPGLEDLLGDTLSKNHLSQLRIAETEKYAHVTYFFNGGLETPYKGEERILIPSPKVATYDLKPEMSANELTDKLVNAIESKQFDFIVCNYANADMVGHTGNLKASIQAIEALDLCLARLEKALANVKGEMLITADHGNVECLFNDSTQQKHTAHTTNLVPLVYVGNRELRFQSQPGTLEDIAPTILTLLKLPLPNTMTGKPLLLP